MRKLIVQKKIDKFYHLFQTILHGYNYVYKVFEDLHEIVRVCFVCNKNGLLFQVKAG